jgi:O-antigen/teichoic acid export membrane protein
MSTTEQPRTAADGGRPEPGRSEGGKALVGGMWTSASQMAPFVYTTIISIVAARILGPDLMGRQSFIAFVVVTVQTVCTSGIAYALSRYVGESIGQGRTGLLPGLVSWAWRVALPVSLFSASVLLAVALAGADPRAAWLFGAVAVLAGGLHKVPGGVLLGGKQWRAQSFVVLATGAVSLVATILVLALGGGISGMLAVTAATSIAMLIWSSRLMRRMLADLAAPPLPLGRLAGEALRFTFATSVPTILSFVVLQRSEIFFVERYSSDAEIARYSIAFSAILAILAVPTAIRSVVLPSVSTLVGQGDFARIQRGYSRLIRLSLLLTIPLTAGALALGPRLIRLVYGDRYAGAGDVLLILAAPIPLVPLSGASSALMMGYGRVRAQTIVYALAAVVDIVAAALLVPHLDAIGAGIANVLALVAVAVPLLLYASRLVGGVQIGWSHLLRTVAASAAAAVAARLTLETGDSALTLLAALVVGVGVFGFLAAALRVLPEEDAEFLAGVARGHRARHMRRFFRRLSGGALGAAR